MSRIRPNIILVARDLVAGGPLAPGRANARAVHGALSAALTGSDVALYGAQTMPTGIGLLLSGEPSAMDRALTVLFDRLDEEGPRRRGRALCWEPSVRVEERPWAYATIEMLVDLLVSPVREGLVDSVHRWRGFSTIQANLATLPPAGGLGERLPVATLPLYDPWSRVRFTMALAAALDQRERELLGLDFAA